MPGYKNSNCLSKTLLFKNVYFDNRVNQLMEMSNEKCQMRFKKNKGEQNIIILLHR